MNDEFTVNHELVVKKSNIDNVELGSRICLEACQVGSIITIGKEERILHEQDLNIHFETFDNYKIKVVERNVDLVSKIYHVKSELIEPKSKRTEDEIRDLKGLFG